MKNNFADLDVLEKLGMLKEKGILTEEEFQKEKAKLLSNSVTETKIIAKTRVTFVLNGYGDLILTDTTLTWNKSATSFLAFGILNACTNNHFMLPLNEIAHIETYIYLGGGGLTITSNKGKEFKFSFKHKKDFKIIYDYLENYIKNRNKN